MPRCRSVAPRPTHRRPDPVSHHLLRRALAPRLPSWAPSGPLVEVPMSLTTTLAAPAGRRTSPAPWWSAQDRVHHGRRQRPADFDHHHLVPSHHLCAMSVIPNGCGRSWRPGMPANDVRRRRHSAMARPGFGCRFVPATASRWINVLRLRASFARGRPTGLAIHPNGRIARRSPAAPNGPSSGATAHHHYRPRRPGPPADLAEGRKL